MPDRLTDERLKPNLSPEFRAAVLGDIQEGRIPMNTAIAVLRSALLDLEALDAEVRALRRVAEDAGLLADGILGGHTCDIQPCRRCGIERASATLQPCVVCRAADVLDALAEWRRVRGE